MNDDRPYIDETSLRWRIALWLDKSRWTCWPNLALFAMGWFVWPWEPFWKGMQCRLEGKRKGCCWCGKFNCPEKMAELYPEDDGAA